jgi:hypothetical protein
MPVTGSAIKTAAKTIELSLFIMPPSRYNNVKLLDVQ